MGSAVSRFGIDEVVDQVLEVCNSLDCCARGLSGVELLTVVVMVCRREKPLDLSGRGGVTGELIPFPIALTSLE